jgi:uncharacterized protein
MSKNKLIVLTKEYVKKELTAEKVGHDFWHTYRVWQMARFLMEKEKSKANFFVIELAALLHDLEDWKFGDYQKLTKVRAWLKKIKVSTEETEAIIKIIQDISFKGADTKKPHLSIEAKIVQDADRLDALGAIGIARTFAYGGYKKRSLHDPDLLPKRHSSFAEYQKAKGSTINHFYEKLLLLKKQMNTKIAKKIARRRHAFMLKFLREFFREWKFL